MRNEGTTTIRLRIETRDRLNTFLAQDRFRGQTVDQLIDYLLTEEWKANCIRQADAWREGHPEEWHADLAELGRWEAADVDLEKEFGPFQLTKTENQDAA